MHFCLIFRYPCALLNQVFNFLAVWCAEIHKNDDDDKVIWKLQWSIDRTYYNQKGAYFR